MIAEYALKHRLPSITGLRAIADVAYGGRDVCGASALQIARRALELFRVASDERHARVLFGQLAGDDET